MIDRPDQRMLGMQVARRFWSLGAGLDTLQLQCTRFVLEVLATIDRAVSIAQTSTRQGAGLEDLFAEAMVESMARSVQRMR